MKNAMTVYMVDPTTGEFLHTWEAQKSPLEKDTFIIPESAVMVPPPSLGKNQTAVYRNGSWATEPDHRGETWFDSKTGLPETITTLGTPPSNLVPNEPVAVVEARAKAPNPQNFVASVKAVFGGPVGILALPQTLQNAIVLATMAVNEGNYADVQAILTSQEAAVGAKDFAAIKAAVAASNLPITLP